MWRSRWFKGIVLALCLAPLVWLAWKWRQNELGINSIEYVARYTGRWTLRLLLLTLAITPLRKIPGLNPIIHLRRMLGLLTFFYGVLHALHYVAVDIQWNWLVLQEDLVYRRFFIAGAVALALMVPLAATSSNTAVRWLGGRRWQRIHRLIYISAIAAVIHYLWQGKSWTMTPMIYAAILTLLLLARVVFAILRRRAKPRRAS